MRERMTTALQEVEVVEIQKEKGNTRQERRKKIPKEWVVHNHVCETWTTGLLRITSLSNNSGHKEGMKHLYYERMKEYSL